MVHFSVLNHLGDSLLEIHLTANAHMHNWKCTLLEVKKSSPPTAIRGEIIYSVSSCHLSLFQSFFFHKTGPQSEHWWPWITEEIGDYGHPIRVNGLPNISCLTLKIRINSKKIHRLNSHFKGWQKEVNGNSTSKNMEDIHRSLVALECLDLLNWTQETWTKHVDTSRKGVSSETTKAFSTLHMLQDIEAKPCFWNRSTVELFIFNETQRKHSHSCFVVNHGMKQNMFAN